MHMVLDDGKRPYETDFKQIAFEKVPKYGDYNRLVLQLDEGEFACYSIRSVKGSTKVQLILKAASDAVLAFSTDTQKTELSFEKSENYERYDVMELTCTGDAVLKITCTKGTVRLKSVIFA